MKRINLYLFLALVLFATQCQTTKEEAVNEDVATTVLGRTFCNPMDLSYRFRPETEESSRREAADPTVVWFKDRYYLFASKSGGYWHSKDLLQWEFLQTDGIPTEEYAPTAISINDTLYFMASSRVKSTLYKSADPLSGKWEVAREELDEPVWDPAFYMDDDNRLYLYWGCSNETPIYGVELDYANNFSFIGERLELLDQDNDVKGWERRGDYNERDKERAYIEGAWMNKANGKYYLQYSGPGTEFKSYNDAIYVADNPLGPYEVQAHNPFAYKPEGYANGAGHGSTFTDQNNNYWHIGTVSISQKHIFERRLSLFPTFIDSDSVMYSITKYGDYPYRIVDKPNVSFDEVFTGWMLLSYKKPLEVSSVLDEHPASQMVDEDIRSYWSAKSGDKGEFAMVDLGGISTVNAVQLNFAEHNTKLYGRVAGRLHRYVLEYSLDKENWKVLDDQSESDTDNTHVYLELPEAVEAKYIKVTNVAVPDGHFAMSGFRVFGKGAGEVPSPVGNFSVVRNVDDGREVSLTWDKVTSAVGYVVSYGNTPDKLYQSYMVYDTTSLTIHSLHAESDYYFSIEAFNENGITKNGEFYPTD